MEDPRHNGDGLTAEVMAVIQEAAAIYLGRKVRIVSVKVHSHGGDGHSSWAEEGRAVLQTSHNLVQRGH